MIVGDRDRDAVALIAAVEARVGASAREGDRRSSPADAGSSRTPRRSTTSSRVAGQGRARDRRRPSRDRRHAGAARANRGIDTARARGTLARVDRAGAHRGARRDRRQGAPPPSRSPTRCGPTRAAVVASLKRRGLAGRDAERRSPGHRRSDRAAGRHRRGDRRSAAGRQGRRDQVAAARRASRGDGRRRPERRARAGAGRRRHGDGVRHRHRGRSRVGHADAQRPGRRRAGDRARPQDDGDDEAEPVLGVRLQRRRHSDRRGRALPGVRHPAEPDPGQRGDGVQLGERGLEQPAPERSRVSS